MLFRSLALLVDIVLRDTLLVESKFTSAWQRYEGVFRPIVIDVIEEAKSPDQLIAVALEMRDRHIKLRNWLKEIQMAVDSEDTKKIVGYKKILEAIDKDIGREVGKGEGAKIALEIGFGFPAIKIEAPIFGGILKKFGMRAILTQQIFSARGETSLNRLLGMFGEKKRSEERRVGKECRL